MARKENIANIKCPDCGSKQSVDIPKNQCLSFFKCEECDEIKLPKRGYCCVICSYSDIRCPVSIVK